MSRLLFAGFLLSLFNLGCQHSAPLITLELSTLDTLSFDKKKPIKLVQFNSSDTLSTAGRAKWRGGWSRQFAKRSFSLDTDRPIALAGMDPHTKWILNASYIDKTLIRHRFWYELWQSMDSNYIASACRYVWLKVNGVDQGIYIAMERIHESRLQIDSTGLLFKDPQVFRKDSIPAEKSDSYFHQKYPDPEVENRDSVLFEFQEFLRNADSLTFSQEINNWIDIDHIVDWHLLLLLSHNGDGVLKNFYVYRKTDTDHLHIIPWDYDHSAGRDGDNELNMRNTFIDDDRNLLLDRLMILNVHGYNDRRCARWNELRQKGIFSIGNFTERIQNMSNELKSRIDDNFKIWPYDGPGFYDANNHEQEIQIMVDYLANRIVFLDDYFNCEN